MDAVLQHLLDKQAISEVIARYSRTLDWLDDDGQAQCYWPDADIDYGFFTGKAVEFVPVVMEIDLPRQQLLRDRDAVVMREHMVFFDF